MFVIVSDREGTVITEEGEEEEEKDGESFAICEAAFWQMCVGRRET